MYARTVGERELTLQVSGMLWQRSLVIRDLETGSLWSHLLGECMRGELKGKSFEMLPGVITSWADWKKRHPKTTVLAMSRTAKKFDLEVWESPSRFVYGVPLGVGKKAPAVSFAKLVKTPVVSVRSGEEALLVTLGKVSKRVQVFDVRVDGAVVEFAAMKSGRMRDSGKGSEWDVVTGECLFGEKKGERLVPRNGMISYRRAWEVFYPGSRIVE